MGSRRTGAQCRRGRAFIPSRLCPLSGRDEDQWILRVVVILLEVGNWVSHAVGEIAVLLLRKGLVFENDQAVFVEKVFDLEVLAGAEGLGIDPMNAAPDIEPLGLHNTVSVR